MKPLYILLQTHQYAPSLITALIISWRIWNIRQFSCWWQGSLSDSTSWWSSLLGSLTNWHFSRSQLHRGAPKVCWSKNWCQSTTDCFGVFWGLFYIGGDLFKIYSKTFWLLGVFLNTGRVSLASECCWETAKLAAPYHRTNHQPNLHRTQNHHQLIIIIVSISSSNSIVSTINIIIIQISRYLSPEQPCPHCIQNHHHPWNLQPHLLHRFLYKSSL